MKNLLVLLKESFLDTLYWTEDRLSVVQSEISKALWGQTNPKRKVEGYYPKGYTLPRSIAQIEEEDIRVPDKDAGYSYFSTLSRGDKTRFLLKKFYSPKGPLYVPSKTTRGSWFVPCFSSIREELRPNMRSNRYLAHQERRIVQAIETGNMELATRIWTILAQRSWSFRVSSINHTKSTRGWYYNMPVWQFRDFLTRIDDILRTWNTNAKYFRVYIPKPDGRERPLGVPSKAWGVVIHMIYRFLILVVKDKISSNQFGFLPKRNGVQAWRKILAMRKEGYTHMYEFDLDGCFNRISVSYVLNLLKELNLPNYFILYMEKLLQTAPIMTELKTEIEVRELNGFIIKSGLPQGWSISPLLSIMVIDRAFKAIGLDPIMYADDGIIMSKTRIDLTKAQKKMLAHWGLVLSKKEKKNGDLACRWIEDRFTFLNITYSCHRQAFRVLVNADLIKPQYAWIKEKDMRDEDFWKIISDEYNPEKEWGWRIDKDSFCLQKRSITSISNWILMKRWIEGSRWVGNTWHYEGIIRRCGLLFVDTQKESSWSSMKLLRLERRRMRRFSLKRISMSDKFILPWLHTLKNPMPLPSLTNPIPSDWTPEYNDPIKQSPSIWYKMDKVKKESIVTKVFGQLANNEMNLESWRDYGMMYAEYRYIPDPEIGK